VSVNQSATKHVEIPQPGKLNFYSRLGVMGAIYRVNNNKLEWVINLNSSNTSQIIVLQPGNYKLVCRATIDKRILATKRVDFEIKSGQVSQLNVM
jgi:uncharacterized surface anchored protein